MTVHPRRRGEHLILCPRTGLQAGSSPQARGTPGLLRVRCGCKRFIPAGAGNTAARGHRTPQKSVHPRRRGEHANRGGNTVGCHGSSPQARGTRPCRLSNQPRRRFIPAGAGNTLLQYPTGSGRAVHPRRRGEHVRIPSGFAYHGGSSPQARGTRSLGGSESPENRFIPAGAGNTWVCRMRSGSWPVHPRRRGEHATSNPLTPLLIGSSPQARGTRARVNCRSTTKRFIPAGAGNTTLNTYYRYVNTVHPRRRGEHAPVRGRSAISYGSSPQARGTQTPDRRRRISRRFIPAGAGNTSEHRPVKKSLPVHPRRRGEHTCCIFFDIFVDGSSPQARGTRCHRPRCGDASRFIPAGAGNTSPQPTRPVTKSVHPRRRGEHLIQQQQLGLQFGSSPQARGTPMRQQRRPSRSRFIPAGAGNTRSTGCTRALAAVHPRRRGEHQLLCVGAGQYDGSSPQARGTQSGWL